MEKCNKVNTSEYQNYFSFTFKLNEKKKETLKNMIWRGGLQERGGEKIKGVVTPKETMEIVMNKIGKANSN